MTNENRKKITITGLFRALTKIKMIMKMKDQKMENPMKISMIILLAFARKTRM